MPTKTAINFHFMMIQGALDLPNSHVSPEIKDYVNKQITEIKILVDDMLWYQKQLDLIRAELSEANEKLK